MTKTTRSGQRLWIRLFLLAVFLTPLISLAFLTAIRFLGHDIRP